MCVKFVSRYSMICLFQMCALLDACFILSGVIQLVMEWDGNPAFSFGSKEISPGPIFAEFSLKTLPANT